ncbi:MAG: hypothetical protein IPN33_08775 [Saprospiraceae bacterium]|nr:hypothetical protein [Saprospiraceae bacterium]
MLAKIFQAIKSFFASLFGGSPKSEPTPTRPPKTKPAPIDIAPQDGSEITPDTIVVVANEMDFPKVQPGDKTPDKDFDDDIFVEEPKAETPPAPAEPPKVEEPTPSPTPTHHQRYLWCLDNGHGKKPRANDLPFSTMVQPNFWNTNSIAISWAVSQSNSTKRE